MGETVQMIIGIILLSIVFTGLYGFSIFVATSIYASCNNKSMEDSWVEVQKIIMRIPNNFGEYYNPYYKPIIEEKDERNDNKP